MLLEIQYLTTRIGALEKGSRPRRSLVGTRLVYSRPRTLGVDGRRRTAQLRTRSLLVHDQIIPKWLSHIAIVYESWALRCRGRRGKEEAVA